MKKKQRIIWLEDREWNKLKQKAQEFGFEGRGCMEQFFRKIASENFIFIKGTGRVRIEVL